MSSALKKHLSSWIEWVRPAVIGIICFYAYYVARDPISIFHIMGPAVVIIMSGSVALESFLLGDIGSEKVGYKPDRPYQIQSALNNLATATTAVIVLIMNWGLHAEATVVTAMLLFFTFSAINHSRTAIKKGNLKKVNLMRPLMTSLLLALLLPTMIKALLQ